MYLVLSHSHDLLPSNLLLVFGHIWRAWRTFDERAQGREKKRTKRDSPLEEKGRADEELVDGHRHEPAFRYRGHPSKHTKDREHFFLNGWI